MSDAQRAPDGSRGAALREAAVVAGLGIGADRAHSVADDVGAGAGAAAGVPADRLCRGDRGAGRARTGDCGCGSPSRCGRSAWRRGGRPR